MESNLHLFHLPPLSELHNRRRVTIKTHLLLYSYNHHHTFSFTTNAIKRRKWDSNAETNRFNFTKNDDAFDNFGDEDEDGGRWRWSDYDWEMSRKSSGGLEDVIDSIWIFKVLKSYGWLLPFIVISLLLNSGPKAFLMAFSVPFGFSLLALAYEKLTGKSQRRRRRKTTRRRKPFVGFAKNLETEDQEDISGAEKGKTWYQSWMDPDGDSFGGWDELERTKSTSRVFRKTKGSKRRTVGKSKMSLIDQIDTPLLLRLLIAVFPFLGSFLD